ncbi:MAG: recombinase family protein [Syntrophaceae bacterium]|nr:recombinase family protein [Syntrophaceae bacterium]
MKQKKSTSPRNESGLIKALIYCRVSSERQKNEGHGLESQEHRCREYAKSRNMEVEKVFSDSFTGGGEFMRRPAMAEMISYIDNKAHVKYAVIFDDVSRLARDVSAHIKLRAVFRQRDVALYCPNYNFDDSPEGEFAEVIIAANAELFRKQNKRQVIQKQKARLEAGYWPFYPPPGYVQKKDPVHGKLLTPDGKALIIKEALEGFASGRFREQADVRKYLQTARIRGDKLIYFEYVKRLLRRPIYAGYVEFPSWEVTRREGRHQAIVSADVFEKIQEKLGGRKYKRSVERDDFPLRGLLVCSDCHRLFTSAWSKGRNNRYPYYRCQRIWCKSKDVRKEIIESRFRETLSRLSPKKEVVLLAERIIKDVWEKREKEQEGIIGTYKKHQTRLQREKEQLIEKIIKTQNEGVLRALEGKLEMIDREIDSFTALIARRRIDGESYGTAVESVLGLLKEPVITWENGGYAGKRLITKLVFVENPVYDRRLGYGTENLSTAVRLFELIQAQKSHDVEMGGVEPPCKDEEHEPSTNVV